MADLRRKQPTAHREPLLTKLVVGDLIALSKDGRYDRNVLLWMQDRYAQQAMVENMGELADLVRAGAAQGAAPDEVRQQRQEALSKFTRETYSAEKGAGRGADLKSYLEAAETFFESESVRYAGHLKEVAEEIAKALANGEKPDIDRISRTMFRATFKMAGAIESLESINKPTSQAVVNMMVAGIKRIEQTAVIDHPDLAVGRQLFQAIERMEKEPEKYIQYVNPRDMEMPAYAPFDYEPVHRSPGF